MEQRSEGSEKAVWQRGKVRHFARRSIYCIFGWSDNLYYGHSYLGASCSDKPDRSQIGFQCGQYNHDVHRVNWSGFPYIWDVQSRCHIALDPCEDRACERIEVSKKRLASLSFWSSYFEAQFSSDGLCLVIEGPDNLNWGQTIKTTVLETKEGKELLPIHCSFSYSDVISSSTGLTAFYNSRSEAKEIRVFNLKDGEEKGKLVLNEFAKNLCFSRDGQSLHCNRGDIFLPCLERRESPLDLFVGREWVRQGSQNLLWLPPT